MIDIPPISGAVAAIGVKVGVVFAVLELRNLVKTRQTDIIIKLYSTFTSKEFVEAYTKQMSLEFTKYSTIPLFLLREKLQFVSQMSTWTY